MHKKISDFLETRIDAGDFPSAVYLVAEKGEIKFHDALGYAVVEPESVEARLDTIYDVASLTKPLVTALMAAQQIEDKDTKLDSKIGDLFPAFTDTPIANRTIKDLATHSSGLPAWKPIYLLTESPSQSNIGEVIANAELEDVGAKVTYSDLNFIALALVIEGARPDLEFDLEVATRLGLTRTYFNPLSRGFDRDEIAASENGNAYERQTCVELGYLERQPEGGFQNKFRNDLIWGEVHDGNAYFMGGVAGHAGLFSTAEEVFKIAQQFLPNHTQLLNPETCELFRTNFTPGLNEDRSFGFQLASTEGSTAGSKMSPGSFGHTGFTGTSLWIDPVKERVFVLLTNRTHNHQLPFVNINATRRTFHDLAAELLDHTPPHF